MTEPQEVSDILDGLTDPTADEVYQAVREFDTRHVLAAVGSKADGSGGGGGSDFTVHPFTLTAAQIKGAGVTPVVLAPAPGANKVLIPVGGILVYKFGTVAFPDDAAPGSFFGVGAIGVNQQHIWNQTVSQTMHLGGPEGQEPQTTTANTAYMLTTKFPGAITSAAPQDGSSGELYAVNDTGTLTGTGDGNATYRVSSVDGGGAITGIVVTAGGTGYSIGQNAVATPGGGQPGSGDSAFVSILAVDSTGVAGDGTAYGQIIYAVQTLT